jgi:hypothetical protein
LSVYPSKSQNPQQIETGGKGYLSSQNKFDVLELNHDSGQFYGFQMSQKFMFLNVDKLDKEKGQFGISQKVAS